MVTIEPLLSVDNLRIEFRSDGGPFVAVDDLSFHVGAGETLAIVGESGSGKSVTALSLLGLVAADAGGVARGTSRFRRRNGTTVDLFAAEQGVLRDIRGDEIAFIFQEPMTSLNPVFTVGEQIAETIRLHRKVGEREVQERVVAALARVRIPDPARRAGQYPHELSGGMRQRAMIAMALACEPRLLIADEPTTALDVTIQAEILDLIRQLSAESGMSIIFITHDMGVVAEMADRVLVMRLGQKMEEGATQDVLTAPRAPYTRMLLASVPVLGSMRGIAGPRKFDTGSSPLPRRLPAAPTRPDAERLTPAADAGPLLDVRGLTTRFPIRKGLLKRVVAQVHAVEDISFTLGAGETLSLVGESGCGKSTTGRSILRLVEPVAGSVRLAGRELVGMPGGELRRARRDMQMVSQDPFASLNPRRTAFQQVAEPLVIHRVARGAELRDRVEDLTQRVGLSPDQLTRYPHEFSGGQRQRLCIARALALSPKLIIADEAVSALDVSIQAQVINLMIDLQAELGVSFLFISHDIGVVERISHRIAVMYMGRIVEIGPRAAVLENPRHDYTKALLASVPNPDPRHRRGPRPRADHRQASAVRSVGRDVLPAVYEEAGPDHRVLVA